MLPNLTLARMQLQQSRRVEMTEVFKGFDGMCTWTARRSTRETTCIGRATACSGVLDAGFMRWGRREEGQHDDVSVSSISQLNKMGCSWRFHVLYRDY